MKYKKHEEHQAKYSQYRAYFKNGKFYIQNLILEDGRLSKCYKIFQSYPKGMLLDIGGGSGTFSEQTKHDVFLLDISKEELKKSKLSKSCIGDMGDTFPFKDGPFDYIFAGESIEHIIDTDFFLKECNRVLKPEGILVITTPNMASLANRFLLLFGKQPKWVDYRCCGASHVRAYTPHSFLKQIEKHDFYILKFTGSWIQPLKFLKGYGIWLGSIFPTLSAHMIVCARKKRV